MKAFLSFFFFLVFFHLQTKADENTVFYLVGNIDQIEFTDLYFENLKDKLSNEEATLVFLGNYSNKIKYDLETDELDYKSNIPDFFLDFIAVKKIKTYFIPGNQEWENGKKTGQDVVNEIEKVYKKRFKKHVKFIPDDAQPGPIVKELNDSTVLIFLNTQFFLQQNIDIARISHDFDDIEDLRSLQKNAYIHFADLLKKYQSKKVLLFGHHPVINNGFYGGNFNAQNNFFPLSGKKRFNFPLPGFLYYTPRKWFGAPQDLKHPNYDQFARAMKHLIGSRSNVIYISGHESNFQLNKMGKSNQLIAGTISKPFDNEKIDIALPGFTRLELKANNKVTIEYLSITDNSLKTSFQDSRTLLPRKLPKILEQDIDYADSTVLATPSRQYDIKNISRKLIGENYREVWATENNFPVFDIEQEKGGLKILKRGGGQQTQSYRLENKDKKQYVLRSVEKNTSGALPGMLKGTFAADIFQDAISASHPYAAVTIPKLAEHAGIYHTNPKIVFVPNDPALGIYRDEMKNRLFLFEERPAKNRDDIDSFGNSKEVISTPNLIDILADDDDAVIDQKFVLRSRLFDIWIADWDRHDDQWRWASFKKDGKTIYRPIPRDRDNAFFNADGSLFKLVELRWVQPKFQGFKPNTVNIEGFNFNGRYFDRSFLNGLNQQEWEQEAVELQKELTDERIDRAIDSSLPENINTISGKKIKEILKQRRDKLLVFAKNYHAFLSKEVDIVGTNDEDLFLIHRYEDSTRVVVFSLSSKKEKIKNQLYQRTFFNKQTKEIRLYGLNDEDKYELNGEANNGIKLRLIGGKGKDKYTDKSNVLTGSKKTLIYDRFGKNKFTKGKETALRLRSSKKVYDYNRKQYKYNTTMPLVAFGYNVDDGVIIGGGFLNRRFNFRDSTMHKLSGKAALLTGAFQVQYEMFTTSIWRNFDLFLNAELSMPYSTDNFFGYGNETVNLLDHKRDYRIRYEIMDVAPSLAWINNEHFQLKTGVRFLHAKLDKTVTHKLFSDLENYTTEEIPTDLFESRNYTGAFLSFNYEDLDNAIFPSRGVKFESTISRFNSLNDFDNFTKLEAHFSSYLSFRKDPRMVLAVRGGLEKNYGDYPLYEAARLGRKTNLRGFRSSRFSGDAAFYQNTDIRLKLKNFNSYVLTGSWGILAFHDLGRVWLDSESSNKWHQGYGAGMWLSPFNFTNLSLQYEHSKEEDLLTLNFNFLF